MTLTVRGFLALFAIFCALCSIKQTIAQDNNAMPLECGERKVKTVNLVQHGTETKEGHWPWHTAIYHREQTKFEYVCGGSIIDRNTILTAAHCMYTTRGRIKVDQLSVQVGRNQLSEASARSQEHQAEQLIVHPGYSPNGVADDIALIKLATDITMTRYVQPVCLWNLEPQLDLIVAKHGTVVGFGLTEHDRVSDFLRQATIGVVDSWTCIESDREVYGATLTGSMYCGGGTAGVSVCNGDSGGGMFFEFGDRWYVRGIVSFMPLREHVALCDGTKYTVFTDVAKYREWIGSFINPTVASERPDPLLVDNSPKLRLLNFNACGISPYAVAGANDSFLAFPWIGFVQMTVRGQPKPVTFCQVALISEWYAVGPAHCFNNDGNDRTIRFGDYDQSTDTDCTERNGTRMCAPPAQVLPIERIIIRPEYDRTAITDDLALIELRQPANVSQPNVKPICLPVTANLRSYKPATFTLGGLPAADDRIIANRATYLNSVNCQERYNAIHYPLRKGHTQFCAIAEVAPNRTEPCQRMLSGSVLQTVQTFGRRERYFLQGLLSFGARDCDGTVPEIYTNVPVYLDWILYNMRELRASAADTSEQLIFAS